MSGAAGDHDPTLHMLLERMLFFSDAVFAIVLTLLALGLRLPAGFDDAHLFDGLAAMKGEIIAFSVSFAVVGVFWVSHLTVMRSLVRFDWWVTIVNLVFLFTVTIVPFTTTLAGAGGMAGNAWRVYCVSIMAISVTQAVLLIVCHRDEPRLLHDSHHGRLRYRLLRAAAPGISFAAGLVFSFTGPLILSRLCWVLVPVLIMLAGRLEARRPKRAATPAAAEPA